VKAVKTHESIGLARDAILPSWKRIADLRKTLGTRPSVYGPVEKRREGIAGRRARRSWLAGKSSEGVNPRSGSGMKQARRVQRGLNPQGPERGRRGKVSGWSRTKNRFATLMTAEGARNLKGGA
jgi:hypothetical protein